MNFSNFFIDMLSGNEPAISAGQKKAANPAFLFSDIMKVCEDETSNPLENITAKSLLADSKEIFSTSDNVIEVDPKEFEAISQLVSMIINQSSDQQPNVITHSVDDATITKQQFLITENKLVNLLSDLIEKGNSSLNPVISLLQSNESNKSISLSFKSGSNKLTVSFNPIKVDESYTNNVINDEFGFVNKLIVKEGFLNGSNGSQIIDHDADENSKPEKSLTTDEDNKISDDASVVIPSQIFFRAEILKIVSENQGNNGTVAGSEQEGNGIVFPKYYSYKILEQENKPAAETQSVNKSTGEGSSEKKPAVFDISNNKILVQDESLSSLKQAEKENDANKYVSNYSGTNISISSDEQNAGGNAKSLSSLLDGLSEEEKSVFKNFASKGEIKEINFKKEISGQINSEEALRDAEIGLNNIINTTSKKNLLNDVTNAKHVQAANLSDIQIDTEAGNVTVKQLVNETPYLTGTQQIIPEEKTILINNDKAGFDSSIKIVTEQQIEKASQSVDTSIALKNYDQELPLSKAKLFAKMNSKLALNNDINTEVPYADSNLIEEDNSNSIKKIVSDEKIINQASFTYNIKLENKTGVLKAAHQNQGFEFNVSMKNSEKKEEQSQVSAKVDTKQQNFSEENTNPKVSASPEKKIEINVETGDKMKIAAKTLGVDKNESAIQSDSTVKLNLKDEKHANTKDKVEMKENSGDETKSVKHTSQDSKSNFASDEESTKKNSTETFKTNFANAITTDFEVEKAKVFTEAKTFHESPKIIKQNEIIPEFSKLIQQGQKQTLTFQITPENLGKVKLTVDLVNNQIQTNIEVENEQVKQFIQTNIDQLKQNLQASGIHVNNLNISLSDYSQKSTGKMFTQKKKTGMQNEKEFKIEDVTEQPLKKMGYNTYEYLA